VPSAADRLRIDVKLEQPLAARSLGDRAFQGY
jgi:hypothetical protein